MRHYRTVAPAFERSGSTLSQRLPPAIADQLSSTAVFVVGPDSNCSAGQSSAD